MRRGRWRCRDSWAGRKFRRRFSGCASDDLLAAVFPDQAACAENLTGEIRIPDHPLVNETIANCLHEAMDLDGLTHILERMDEGSLRTVAVDTPEPSPFSHEILNANPYAYLDDAPLEERRARAVQLRRTLSTEDAGGIGALDPAAIAQVAEESWPVVRDADELHDALLTLIVLPPVAEWQALFDELRACRTSFDGGRLVGRDGAARTSWRCDRDPARLDGFDRAGETARSSPSGWGLPLSDVEIGLGAARIGRTDSARAILVDRNAVLPPAHSGADSSADAGPLAARDRAGADGGVHAIPVPLAASCAGHATARRRRAVPGSAPACRAMRFRRRPGNRWCCRGAWPITIRSGSTGCVCRVK